MSGELTSAETKTCPYCAETIKFAAIRCRYCQADIALKEAIETAQAVELTKNQRIPCGRCTALNSSDADTCGSCGISLPYTRSFARTSYSKSFSSEQEQIIERLKSKPSGSGRSQLSAANRYSDAYSGPVETPGVAIAAIICAFIFPLLGLILGYSARSDIRASHGRKAGEGLASAAIVIGWIEIIALVIWLIWYSVTLGNIAYQISH